MSQKSDVVGSLLRPPYLLDARARIERGELTPSEFKRIEDRAVGEAVALQEDAESQEHVLRSFYSSFPAR